MSNASLVRPKLGDDLVLVVCAALLASSFSAIRLALELWSPLQVAALRCAVAFVALLPLALVRGRSFRGYLGHAILVSLLGYAIPFSLLAWAETRLGAGHTAILFCSGPVFAVLIARTVATDERSTRPIWPSMLLASLGILVMNLDTLRAGTWPDLLALVCVLACALCYALAGLWARKSGADALTLTTQSLGWASALLILVCLVWASSLPSAFKLAAPSTLSVLYLGLVPTALCSALRYQQIHKLGYTFVSFTGYLVPILGLVIAYLILDEPFKPTQLVGLVLALCGLAFARRAVG